MVTKNMLAVDQKSVKSVRQVSASLQSLGRRQGRRFPRPRMPMEHRHLTDVATWQFQGFENAPVSFPFRTMLRIVEVRKQE